MTQTAKSELEKWIESGFGGRAPLEKIQTGAALENRESLQIEPEPEGAEAAPSGRWHQGARLLRWIGAVTLVASAIVFVSQRWEQMDSILRYYSFLGFTGVLAGVGLFCGLGLKESKGARTLLAMSAAFLPAHFAQIGALIHSQFGDIFPAAGSMMILKAPSGVAAFQVLGIALVFLIPIAYLGFSSMARVAALTLTGVYLVSNAVLLIPVREPNLVALIGAALFGALLIADRILFRTAPLRTWDGIAVRTMLFVPVAVIAARNFISYPVTALLCSFVAAVSGIALDRFIAPAVPERFRPFVRWCGNTILVFAWFQFLLGTLFGNQAIFRTFGASINDGLYLPINILPLALYMVLTSLRQEEQGRGQRRNGARLAIYTSILNLMMVGGLPASFVCLVVSIATILGAFAMEERAILYSGAVGSAAALVYYLHYAWQNADISPWLALAVLGTSTVVLSSYIERNHKRIFERFGRFRARVLGWS